MSDSLEIRNEPELDDATIAVNELRTASETFRTNMTAELAKRDARIATLETRMARPPIIRPENRIAAEKPLHLRALNAFIRGYDANLLDPEVRTVMTEATTGAGGGYLVPPEFFAEIDRNLILYSPMRSLARVIQVSTNSVLLPNRTSNLAASWEGETDAEPVTNAVYGQNDLTVYEMKCFADVSLRLIEDSAFDINAELSLDLGQAFGQLEGQAFVSGTGDSFKQPLGLIGSTVTTTTTAGAAAITAAELINFFYSLPSPYAANATWVANRQTIGYLRQIVNSAGFYVWQGPLAGIDKADPNTLLGRPVVEFPDMPNIGAGNIPVAFGDFNSGFRIADRVGLAILRDPYTQQTAGNVRFHARRRVGGMVTKAEAIRLLKNAAS
jgi:HK97 family phage major capsid protein